MSKTTEELFKELFSSLILYRHNIHILHWKCCGPDFDATHELMDKYLEKFSSMIDGVGEIMLELGLNPLGLCEIMKTLDESDNEDYMCIDGDDEYASQKVYEYISFMFKGLIDMYEKICYDKALPSDITGVLDDHREWLRLERDYKNVRRAQ
jgi:DNA-binding ferritin-like protein